VGAAVTNEAALNVVGVTDLAALVRSVAAAAEDVQQARNHAAIRTTISLDGFTTDPARTQTSFQARDRAIFAAAEQAVLPGLTSSHV